MFLLTIISILISFSFGEAVTDDLTYLLPSTVTPIHYKITIVPNLVKKTFVGTVVIKIAVEEPTNEIILHQKGLNITLENIRLTEIHDESNNITVRSAGVFGTKQQQFFKISLLETLEVKGYILSIINYKGLMKKEIIGFYYETYIDKSNIMMTYAATQFQPTFARYAFPCFDEPALKAIFQILIVRPKNYNSVSNSVLLSSRVIGENLVEDLFEETERMSTYLLSFIISQLKNSRKVGVNQALARPEHIRNGLEQHFLRIADRILVYFQDLFNSTYVLGILQHAALPSLINLDTENWGVITYHESTMEYFKITSVDIQQHLILFLAEKICHQWIGNLITLEWWNYTWLNEGFCMYSSYMAVDSIFPEWNVTQNSPTHDTDSVMYYDYLKSVQPLTHDVSTHDDIADIIYNSVSRLKGAAIFRMLEAIMNPTCFLRGLSNYTNTYDFGTVQPLDLYETMQEFIDTKAAKIMENLTIPTIMATWESQSGFPLINVKRNYDEGTNMQHVTITQRQFRFNHESSSNATWVIPINFITKSNPFINNTDPTHWLTSTDTIIDINQLTKNDWLIVNRKQACMRIDYYRVNYDRTNWDMIIKALDRNLHSIHLLNRIQLIQDSFAMASIGLTDMSIPFKITKILEKETEYSPMQALKTTLDNFQKRLIATVARKPLKEFIKSVVIKIYERYERILESTNNHRDKLIIELIISWLCQLNHATCKSDAAHNFVVKSQPKYLNKHIMCYFVKNSDEKRWESLFKKYNSTTNPIVRSNMCYALGCTRNEKLAKRLLNFPHEEQFYNIISSLQSLMAQGKQGLEITLKYLSKEFSSLFEKFGRRYMNDLLINIGSRITTQDQLNMLWQLSNMHRSKCKSFDVAVEKAQENIQWNKDHLIRVTNYFGSYRSSIALRCLPVNTIVLVICVILLVKF